VQWSLPRSWLTASCSVLISVMFIACQGSDSATNSAMSGNDQRRCLELNEIRYPQPPSYRENSVGGAEISIDDETRELRIHMSIPGDAERSPLWEDGIFVSDDGGESWKVVAPPSPVMNEDVDVWPLPPADHKFRHRTVAEAAPTPYLDRLGMGQEKRWFMERSEDGGRHWRRTKARIVASSESIDRFMLRGYHLIDPRVFYISARIVGSKVLAGLFVTKDGGESFELILVGRSTVHFAVGHSNPSVMYAANEFGSLVKSENGGELWNLLDQDCQIRELIVSKKTDAGIQEATIPDGNDIYRIEIDPTDTDRVFVLTKKGVLKTTDGGKNWCVLNLGTGITTAVNSIVIDPKNPRTIFWGTWAGLYRSKDRGETWEKVQISERASGKM